MSSLSTLRRPLLRAGLIAVLGLGLSACFRPLYGPTASGVPLQDLLASIKIDTVKSDVTPIATPEDEVAHTDGGTK